MGRMDMDIADNAMGAPPDAVMRQSSGGSAALSLQEQLKQWPADVPQPSVDVTLLLEEAHHRWLKCAQVGQLLVNFKEYGFTASTTPPRVPTGAAPTLLTISIHCQLNPTFMLIRLSNHPRCCPTGEKPAAALSVLSSSSKQFWVHITHGSGGAPSPNSGLAVYLRQIALPVLPQGWPQLAQKEGRQDGARDAREAQGAYTRPDPRDPPLTSCTCASGMTPSCVLTLNVCMNVRIAGGHGGSAELLLRTLGGEPVVPATLLLVRSSYLLAALATPPHLLSFNMTHPGRRTQAAERG